MYMNVFNLLIKMEESILSAKVIIFKEQILKWSHSFEDFETLLLLTLQ